MKKMIPLFTAKVTGAVDAPLLKTLHSGYITQGPKVDEFEARLSDYLGTKRTVTLNSCTSALTLALRLAGVGPGDEVISTPMTCTATNLPVVTAGATLVWSDIDEDGLIDPRDIERHITKKTKAIMAVDWGGLPCDMDAIMDIAKRHKLKVISDAAHAFGAEYKGKKVGTLAHYTCFSFQAIKHLTTGDGGLLTTCCDPDYTRARTLRWFGIDRDAKTTGDSRIDQDIAEAGYKFHMNDINATIGIVQMDHIEKIVDQHRKNAAFYDTYLDPYFAKPNTAGHRRSAYWLYTIKLPNKQARDKFKQYMLKANIHVSEVHKRNDEYEVFKKFSTGKLKGVDNFANRMICLPVHSDLTSEQLDYIVKTANKFVEGKK